MGIIIPIIYLGFVIGPMYNFGNIGGGTIFITLIYMVLGPVLYIVTMILGLQSLKKPNVKKVKTASLLQIFMYGTNLLLGGIAFFTNIHGYHDINGTKKVMMNGPSVILLILLILSFVMLVLAFMKLFLLRDHSNDYELVVEKPVPEKKVSGDSQHTGRLVHELWLPTFDIVKVGGTSYVSLKCDINGYSTTFKFTAEIDEIKYYIATFAVGLPEMAKNEVLKGIGKYSEHREKLPTFYSEETIIGVRCIEEVRVNIVKVGSTSFVNMAASLNGALIEMKFVADEEKIKEYIKSLSVGLLDSEKKKVLRALF